MVTHITRTNVDSVNWTPIVAPYECDFVAFYSEARADVAIRSNASDPTTEKQLAGGVQESLSTTPSRHRRTSRFFVGEVLYYVKTLTGTDVIVSTWSGME
jgi:hypothetical protein